MGEIKIMPEVLANQIAAGEVVERPSSIVKELVENSIDAKSNQIIIELIESGIQQIKVTDNGIGMDADDLKLSFSPHATSKIYNTEDLFKIMSLGFRGEALASIASVSEVYVESKTSSSTTGNYILIKGSKIEDLGISKAKNGTSITVNHLFYNTPARLKHLKSLNTELKHILNYIQNIALSYPEIKFSLFSDTHLIFQSIGNGSLQQAIASVYQPKLARELIEISNEDYDFKISGFISSPALTRTTQSYIHWIINGRPVKSRVLNEVLIRAYGRQLMIGRYPISVIHINLDPRLVDVNVHPTKQTVRLSKEDELSALIKKSIYEVLNNHNPIPSADEKVFSAKHENISVQENFDFSYTKPDNQQRVTIPKESEIMLNQTSFIINEDKINSSLIDSFDRDNQNNTNVQINSEKFDKKDKLDFYSLHYVGQIQGTYLIAEYEDGFYLIDQHAAQEKIRYENFMDENYNYQIQQHLLIPEIISFTPEQYLQIEMIQDKLEAIGIELSPFGPTSYQLESYPQWLEFDDLNEKIIDVTEFIIKNPDAKVQNIIENSLIMKSCRGAIKANHHLEDSEAIHLIQSLATLKDPYHCPHGRPILVKVSNKTIEKWFKRIQDSHTTKFDSQF